MRLIRFFRSVRWLVKQRLLSRHNLRAMWIQSDPGWRDKLPPLDLTDEEWEEFMEALSDF